MIKLKKTEVIVNDKVWTRSALVELMAQNDEALIRAMFRIYDKQTKDEKSIEATVEDNGVGFSGVHGNIMSSFAKFYQERKYLSKKQMETIHKIMPRYAGQLLKMMAYDNMEYNQHFFKVRGR